MHTYTVYQASIVTHNNIQEVTPETENVVVIVCLNRLFELQMSHLQLTPIAQVASQCLKIDFTKRPTASQILNMFYDNAM